MKTYKCECGKEFTNRQSYCGHCSRCSIHLGHPPTPLKRNPSGTSANKGRICINNGTKNKFINKEDLNDYLLNGWVRGHLITSPRVHTGRASTEEKESLRRHRISVRMKSNPNSGGYRVGSGRGKKGWYKGIHCDSSWELAFLIYHLDHNINISRCTEIRSYEYLNKTYKYYPDFVVNGKIYEVKGMRSDQWQAKITQNPDIIVIDSSNISPYIDYCVSTYGSDYIKLYEDHKVERLDPTPDQRVWITNGIENHTILYKNYSYYESLGYRRGRITHK